MGTIIFYYLYKAFLKTLTFLCYNLFRINVERMCFVMAKDMSNIPGTPDWIKANLGRKTGGSNKESKK